MIRRAALDNELRAKLARLCLDRGMRINGRNFDAAHRWMPFRVRHPEHFRPFTEEQAWEFISDQLAAGIKVRVEPYRKGGNIDCFVMLAAGCDDDPPVYIKIAYMEKTDQVLGASFHTSDRQ